MAKDKIPPQFDIAPKLRDFTAPVPGQSLTKAPGSTPMEHSPQFADPNDACEYLFDQLTSPRTAAKLIALLKAGAPAEALARTFVFTGVMNGKWTPDVALLIVRTVWRMVIAIAAKCGLTDIKLLNPRNDYLEFVNQLGGLEEQYEVTPKDETKEISTAKGTDFSGIMGAL